MKMRFCKMVISMATIGTLLMLLIVNCSQKENKSDVLPEIETLLKKIDEHGRLVKTVITGRIPGEDIYLTITRFDSLGRMVAQYGAKPYGEKFKFLFKYDSQDRITEEIIYEFSSDQQFENYKSGVELYSLPDTLADFEKIRSKLKTYYIYNDIKKLTTERHYRVMYDSLVGEVLEILYDTIYQSKKIQQP